MEVCTLFVHSELRDQNRKCKSFYELVHQLCCATFGLLASLKALMSFPLMLGFQRFATKYLRQYFCAI